MDDDVSRGRPGRESGAATLETVGMALVAATLATGVVVATVPAADAMSRTLSTRVCQVVTLGQGGCTTPAPSRSARSVDEACVASPGGNERVDAAEATTFSTAEGRRVAVQRSTTGQHRVRVGDDRTDRVDLGGGLTLSPTTGTVEVPGGEVYLVDGSDLPDLVDTLVQDHVKDVVAGGSGPMRWLTDGASRLVDGELPEPDEVVAEGDVSLNASDEATGPIPRGDDGTQARVLATRTAADGSATIFLSALLDGDALGLDADEVPVMTSLDLDPEGNVVRLAATASSGEADGDGVTVHQLSLPTDTDAGRAVAARFLSAQGRPLPTGWTPPDPDDATTLAADPLAELVLAAREGGAVTEQTYGRPTRPDTVPDEIGLDESGAVDVVRVPVDDARRWSGGGWADWSPCD
ncbi:hypothetical protein ABFT23_00140 [Nocardioides sp. C4-1]|uniref:hypothetical protein n=1 Tax=Nocardioides sp. C4-1 TaxID=3151851 RepID=UPI00326585BE